MFRYNKTTQCAITALSRLAEVYDEGTTLLSSSDIAKQTTLSRPLVAKLLTILAQNELIQGTPGPGGGYMLSRPPAEISLFDVAVLFERTEELDMCPFSPAWCGKKDPCALHGPLLKMHETMLDFLKNTRFDVFQHSNGTQTP